LVSLLVAKACGASSVAVTGKSNLPYNILTISNKTQSTILKIFFEIRNVRINRIRITGSFLYTGCPETP